MTKISNIFNTLVEKTKNAFAEAKEWFKTLFEKYKEFSEPCSLVSQRYWYALQSQVLLWLKCSYLRHSLCLLLFTHPTKHTKKTEDTSWKHLKTLYLMI